MSSRAARRRMLLTRRPRRELGRGGQTLAASWIDRLYMRMGVQGSHCSESGCRTGSWGTGACQRSGAGVTFTNTDQLQTQMTYGGLVLEELSGPFPFSSMITR